MLPSKDENCAVEDANSSASDNESRSSGAEVSAVQRGEMTKEGLLEAMGAAEEGQGKETSAQARTPPAEILRVRVFANGAPVHDAPGQLVLVDTSKDWVDIKLLFLNALVKGEDKAVAAAQCFYCQMGRKSTSAHF